MVRVCEIVLIFVNDKHKNVQITMFKGTDTKIAVINVNSLVES